MGYLSGCHYDDVSKFLTHYRSVKAFAEEYKSKGFPIHGLINNAGIFLVKNEITPDGFEVCALQVLRFIKSVCCMLLPHHASPCG